MFNSSRIKWLLKAVSLMAVAAYTSLVLYYSLSNESVDSCCQTESWAYNAVDRSTKPTNVVTPSPVEMTGTMRPPDTTLDDVFITVKTTQANHLSRIDIILKTWFQLAKKQTWFFTDADDPEFSERTDNHMINTHCASSHGRKALCCKTAMEFDIFLESGKKWFCHFDDDNYVNVPRLVRRLGEYNPQEDWYLGRPSVSKRLKLSRDVTSKNVSFWFATGGAGYCLSKALALKMVPEASGGKFASVCEKIKLPDDVTMGYIIEYLFATPLTVIDEFHSHIEPLKFLRLDELQDQISLSYSLGNTVNVVKIDGFDLKYDPQRFLSLHCHLFPRFRFCPSD